MDIRDIEKIIDEYHTNHDFLSGNKIQLTYELLTTFEDLCMCTVLASFINPLAVTKITDHMDSLNQALSWVENSCLLSSEHSINRDISEKRYEQCVSFLTEYAYPYSRICSGYIAFSRKRLLADIKDKTVIFTFPEDSNESAWNDILREVSNMEFGGLMEKFHPARIMKAYLKLQERVSIENKQLCYELNSKILNPFLEIAEEQWNATKTLPNSWRFDMFTINEYKSVWVAITALCYIHFFSCLSIKEALIRINNALIIQSIESIVDYVSQISGVDKEIVEKIIKYLTFEPAKRNVDIMYQPIIVINNTIFIAPMLFMGSRAERNLLALVNSEKDFEHSKEVNDLEDLMATEIEDVIPKSKNVKIIKHKGIGEKLPDIDLGIYDKITNSVLLCELKWFTAADSSKEVYAREDDITHGCEQIYKIMAYAMRDKKHFLKQVFNVENGDDVDLFCCVVAKHNIRTKNKYVPVIDVNKIKQLFSNKSVNSVFHSIRNHEYEEKLPEDAEITFQCVEYGGFSFKIPAICLGNMPE